EPVADLVPGELVKPLREQVEAVAGEVAGGLGAGRVQAREDPLLRVGDRLWRAPIRPSGTLPRGRGKGERLGVHQREAGRVPQLVAEVLVALRARQVELDVTARAGQRGHGEAQRVGAVGVDAGGELLARGLL